MFSYQSYIWKCVLGSEIIYVLCMVYRAFVAVELLPLHDNLLRLMPGFSLTPAGIVIAGIGIAVYSAVFGAYMVWMLNSSVAKQ